MRVSSHQIYNILNIYSKWLSKNGKPSMERFSDVRLGLQHQDISTDRYRKSIMQKVTGNILTKITCLESNGKRSLKIAEKLKNYERKNGRKEESNGDTFVFNSIENGSKKSTKKLFIDKTSLLAK